jgi:hypothetical protein
MLSYYSDPAIKARYLARVEAHADADEIIKGKYWQDGKGCAVGCTVHGDSHEAFELELGIPRMLAWLEDAIFEGLPNRAAKTWPKRFLSDIAPGNDLSHVGWQLLHWLLTESDLGNCNDPLVAGCIKQCAAVLLPLSSRHLADRAAAEAAAAVAWAACKQAASQGLESAQWAAESAARAAESAALSLADPSASAELAVTALTAAVSRSRDYITVSDKLLELLRAPGSVDELPAREARPDADFQFPAALQLDAVA